MIGRTRSVIDKANDPTVGAGNETANSGERPAVGDARERGNEEANRDGIGGESASGAIESADKERVVVGMKEIAKRIEWETDGIGAREKCGRGCGRGGGIGVTDNTATTTGFDTGRSGEHGLGDVFARVRKAMRRRRMELLLMVRLLRGLNLLIQCGTRTVGNQVVVRRGGRGRDRGR